jgi:uncharacterized protein (DUF1778 family)
MSHYVRPLGLPPANPAFVEELPPEPEAAEHYITRIHLRTTTEQKQAWTMAAKAAKRPLSEWVRDRLDEASDGADDGGSDGFTQRRMTMARRIAVDLLDLRQTYGGRSPQLAAAIKRIEDRVDTLEDLIR